MSKLKYKGKVMKKISIILFLILSISIELFAARETSQQEKDGLMAIYNSMGGSNWTESANWGTDNDPCNTTEGWFGVVCDGAELNTVTKLLLSENNLTGSIPSGVENLIHIVELDLSHNSITGAIPPEIGNLSTLKILDLSANEITGAIPSEIGNLSALSELHLDWNKLQGSIPSSIGDLGSLAMLFMWDNQLSGAIPSSIGNLESLTNIDLGENQLSGSIPATLGALTNLVDIYLDENNLTGTIPSELGNLDNLQVLNFELNHLSGTIPFELTALNLEDDSGLNLSKNCSLSSGNNDTQNFIVSKSSVATYDEFLATQGNCPDILVLAPIITYILN